jgi:hypothetical protein
VCCANERMIELACPESCSYLIEARSTASQKERLLLRKEAETNSRDLRMTERALLALNVIEEAIVKTQRGINGPALRDLNDAEAIDALENAIKNAETEDSGLIYEHSAASPRITEVSRRVREALKGMADDIPAEARPRRADIQKAFAFARDAAKAHQRRVAGAEPSLGYIRYITLFSPWPEDSAKPLIV